MAIQPRQRIRPVIPRRHATFHMPHSHFRCTTIDGVPIAGTMLGGTTGDTALVLAHGFMGYRTKPKSSRLADALASRYPVFTFDLRGHGESGGACTGGAVEHLDIEAVAGYARLKGFSRIVTIGWSLGGIAVVRHGVEIGNVQGVVAISTPAQWGGHSKAVRRVSWMFVTKVGRTLVRELMGTRIDLRSEMPDPPAAIIKGIAPAAVLIVHGTDDHFFGPDAGRELFDAAAEPKRLLQFDRFGHAEDGFSSAFAARLCTEIDAMLSPA